jgi:hypothetical protein
MKPMQPFIATLALPSLLALGGGATQMPRPWERGHLASPQMAWDPDRLLAAQRDHTYVSKEAAAGGADAGGGGCGCN